MTISDVFSFCNILDLIIFVILIIYTISGFYFGFVRTIIDTIFLLISIILLILIYPHSKGFFLGYIQNELALFLVSVISLYIGFIIFHSFTKSHIKPVLDNFRLGIVNHILGGVVGFLKGFIISLILFMMFVVISLELYKKEHIKDHLLELEHESYPNIVKDSQLFSLLDFYMKGFIIYIPGEMFDKVQDFKFTDETTE